MNMRNEVTALSVGRILVGLGLSVAPAAIGGQWVGRAASEPATQVFIRAMGVRDLALGVATLGTLRATGTRGTGFKVLVALGVLCDAVDAAATIKARRSLPQGGKLPAGLAIAAAATGAVALVRP